MVANCPKIAIIRQAEVGDRCSGYGFSRYMDRGKGSLMSVTTLNRRSYTETARLEALWSREPSSNRRA